MTRFGSTSGNLVVSYTIGGSATGGSDDTALTGSITILDASTFADITVTPLNDALVESPESVTLTLTDGAAYDLAPPTQGTVMIAAADSTPPPSTITVDADDPNVSEPGANLGRFKISRGSDTIGELTVQYTISGTATSGADYTALGTMSTIPDGQTHTYVYVMPVDNNVVEPSETVTLTLQADSSFVIGTTGAVTVTITDDDANVSIQVPERARISKVAGAQP